MTCRPLCGACCGPVPASVDDLARIRVYLDEHGIGALDNGPVDCPFLTEAKGCLVYPVRPTICRLQGRAEGLACVYGAHEQVIDKGAAGQIIAAAGPPVATLHMEFSDGWDEDEFFEELERRHRGAKEGP